MEIDINSVVLATRVYAALRERFLQRECPPGFGGGGRW